MRLACIVLVLSAIGCEGGTITGGADGGVTARCTDQPGNMPPDAPAVLSPVAGDLEVTAESFRARTAGFSDDDGGAHLASAFELWLLAGDEPVARVWSAELAGDARLTGASLDDGAFESGFAALWAWQRYGVRARHLDDGCAWSDWSPWIPFRVDDGSTHWFADGVLRQVSLEIPEDSFAAIDAEAQPDGCMLHERSYHPGAASVDGARYEGVGLRAKGGCGSARGLDDKPGVKVHLSWDDPEVPGCPETRRDRGLQRFTFNNQVQDPSKVHEPLAYRFYRGLGVPTPRTAPVTLEVDGEDWGVYLHVETYDRRFLSRWFQNHQGMLYEGVYDCDVVSANVPESEDGASGCFQKKFYDGDCSAPDPGADPTTWEPLRALTAALDALPEDDFYPGAGDHLDLDAFFTLWAADAVLGHWDGFFYNRNNYRLYHDPRVDRWVIIPHGLDQTFTAAQDPFAVRASLGQRCLQEEDCTAAFAARLREVADAFEAQGPELAQAARAHQALIAPHWTSEREVHDPGTVDAQVDATVAFIEARPQQIRASLDQRGL